MGCPNRVIAPCGAGDGNPCRTPSMVLPCGAEPVCDSGIRIVPGVAMHPGQDIWTITWTGVHIGDDLQLVIKNADTNEIVKMYKLADVQYNTVGSFTSDQAIGSADYLVGMRRIEGDMVSAWNTIRYVHAAPYYIIVDGSDIIVDSSADAVIVDMI